MTRACDRSRHGAGGYGAEAVWLVHCTHPEL